MRSEVLANLLRDFLKRRAVPVHLREDASARKAEFDALMARLLQLAPSKGFEEWFQQFSECLDDQSQHRTWPSVNEVRGAARMVQKNWRVVDGPSGNVVDMTPAAINLRRLRRGDALGSEWLYGVLAVELLKQGATEAELDAYRSGLFFDMRQVWGEEVAREKERDLRARHDSALTDNGMRRRFATFIPTPGRAAE